MLVLVVVLLLAGFAPGSGTAHAEDRVLTLSMGPEVRRFTAAQLLDRPDAAELTIPADVSYGRPMKYRAVPLLPLVSVGPAFDTIEARAADGFVSQIPLALVAKGATGGSLFFTTADCRKTYEMLLAKGVEFTDGPTERPYGIDCGLRDPFGNRIRFSQPLPAPAQTPRDGKRR